MYVLSFAIKNLLLLNPGGLNRLKEELTTARYVTYLYVLLRMQQLTCLNFHYFEDNETFHQS